MNGYTSCSLKEKLNENFGSRCKIEKERFLESGDLYVLEFDNGDFEIAFRLDNFRKVCYGEHLQVSDNLFPINPFRIIRPYKQLEQIIREFGFEFVLINLNENPSLWEGLGYIPIDVSKENSHLKKYIDVDLLEDREEYNGPPTYKILQ